MVFLNGGSSSWKWKKGRVFIPFPKNVSIAAFGGQNICRHPGSYMLRSLAKIPGAVSWEWPRQVIPRVAKDKDGARIL
jgi:hypothetical protein